jgi:hypothetical protein
VKYYRIFEKGSTHSIFIRIVAEQSGLLEHWLETFDNPNAYQILVIISDETLSERLHNILNESKISISIIPGRCSILGI